MGKGILEKPCQENHSDLSRQSTGVIIDLCLLHIDRAIAYLTYGTNVGFFHFFIQKNHASDTKQAYWNSKRHRNSYWFWVYFFNLYRVFLLEHQFILDIIFYISITYHYGFVKFTTQPCNSCTYIAWKIRIPYYNITSPNTEFNNVYNCYCRAGRSNVVSTTFHQHKQIQSIIRFQQFRNSVNMQ